MSSSVAPGRPSWIFSRIVQSNKTGSCPTIPGTDRHKGVGPSLARLEAAWYFSGSGHSTTLHELVQKMLCKLWITILP
jgi:hypothetical protein